MLSVGFCSNTSFPNCVILQIRERDKRTRKITRTSQLQVCSCVSSAVSCLFFLSFLLMQVPTVNYDKICRRMCRGKTSLLPEFTAVRYMLHGVCRP